MSSSLPLLCQRFITGLNDQLRMMCAQALHALLSDKGKGLDGIASELRSMCLLLEPSVDMANSTQSRQTTRPPNAQKEIRTCNYCGKVGNLKAACRKYKRENGKPEQAAIVMATIGEGFVSASMDTDAYASWFDTMATHLVVHSNDKHKPTSIDHQFSHAGWG
jgi:hypothetical protein